MFCCAQMLYCQRDVAVNCLKINHPHLNVMFLLRFSRNRFRRLDTAPPNKAIMAQERKGPLPPWRCPHVVPSFVAALYR